MAYLDFEHSYVGQLRKAVGNRRLITPAARAVIFNSEGQVLLVRRSDNGEWVMPAGSMELGESIYDCLKREVREEAGLEVLSARPMAMYTAPRYHFTNAYGGEHQMFTVVFLVEDWTGEVQKETDETVDARFFDLDDLPPIPALFQETLEDVQAFTGELILK
ncbi:NUDIX domain-containing protein [bacterium]|nr:NUDIX domain-containing protein [bacterium]